jgi:hypothetical protein
LVLVVNEGVACCRGAAMSARTFVVALLGMIVLTAVGCGSGDGNKDSAD